MNIKDKSEYYEDKKNKSHQNSVLQVYYNYMHQLIFFLRRELKEIINMKKEIKIDQTFINNQFFLSIITYITLSFSAFETAIKDLYISKTCTNRKTNKEVFKNHKKKWRECLDLLLNKKNKNDKLRKFSEMRNGIHDFGLLWPDLKLKDKENFLMKINEWISEGEKVILDIVKSENLENTKSPSFHYFDNFK